MSFDGEYVRDVREASFEECRSASANMGSKWFFYPFHMIVNDDNIVMETGGVIHAQTESGDFVSILSEKLSGMSLPEVSFLFNELSQKEEMENADAEAFEWAVASNSA